MMKITATDLLTLKSYIDPVFEKYPNVVELYETGQFPRADTVKNLQERFCFDVLRASRIKIGDGAGVKGDLDLYAYANDNHIFTALKAICPRVTRKY